MERQSHYWCNSIPTWCNKNALKRKQKHCIPMDLNTFWKVRKRNCIWNSKSSIKNATCIENTAFSILFQECSVYSEPGKTKGTTDTRQKFYENWWIQASTRISHRQRYLTARARIGHTVMQITSSLLTLVIHLTTWLVEEMRKHWTTFLLDAPPIQILPDTLRNWWVWRSASKSKKLYFTFKKFQKVILKMLYTYQYFSHFIK